VLGVAVAGAAEVGVVAGHPRALGVFLRLVPLEGEEELLCFFDGGLDGLLAAQLAEGHEADRGVVVLEELVVDAAVGLLSVEDVLERLGDVGVVGVDVGVAEHPADDESRDGGAGPGRPAPVVVLALAQEIVGLLDGGLGLLAVGLVQRPGRARGRGQAELGAAASIIAARNPPTTTVRNRPLSIMP